MIILIGKTTSYHPVDLRILVQRNNLIFYIFVESPLQPEC